MEILFIDHLFASWLLTSEWPREVARGNESCFYDREHYYSH